MNIILCIYSRRLRNCELPFTCRSEPSQISKCILRPLRAQRRAVPSLPPIRYPPHRFIPDPTKASTPHPLNSPPPLNSHDLTHLLPPLHLNHRLPHHHLPPSPHKQTVSNPLPLPPKQPPPHTMSTADPSSPPHPSLFRYTLSFLLVGIAWGLTTPFIRRAALDFHPAPHSSLTALLAKEPSRRSSSSTSPTSTSRWRENLSWGWWWVRVRVLGAFWTVLDLLRSPRYAAPLVVNLTGSVWFFLLVGGSGACFPLFSFSNISTLCPLLSKPLPPPGLLLFSKKFLF